MVKDGASSGSKKGGASSVSKKGGARSGSLKGGASPGLVKEKKSKDEVFSALKEAFGGDDPKEEEMEYASAMLHQHR